MKVKIKKLVPEAIIPVYAKLGDAGLDLTATSLTIDELDNHVYGTGLAIEIPEDYVGLIFPRSSIANIDLNLANSVGVIDSGYRGELIIKFKSRSAVPKHYKVGERIAQLLIIPYPQIHLEETTELSLSDRGEGGFGSTNKK